MSAPESRTATFRKVELLVNEEPYTSPFPFITRSSKSCVRSAA